MDIKIYTDKQYVPLTDLVSLNQDFISKIKDYRDQHKEFIKLSDLSFVSLVETPKLVKKRYSKNVEIKEKLNIEAKDNDFILEIAKRIVKDNKKYKLNEKDYKILIKKFEENEKDLTIITDWIIENINLFIQNQQLEDSILKIIPHLSKKDLNFIFKYSNKNSYCSIEKYLKINQTSYETGRKSMERMTKYNIFTKEKVGKKFIYKPTKKIIELIKRSQ